MGLPAYTVSQSEAHFNYYSEAILKSKVIFVSPNSLLSRQEFTSPNLQKLKTAVQDYPLNNEIIPQIKMGEDSMAREVVIIDKGYEAFKALWDFSKELLVYGKQFSSKRLAAFKYHHSTQ